jgi:LysR family carnitine catabolism transcriptional activator
MLLDPRINARQIVACLATFIAVAETGSFRRAAQVIGRSQPAVTAQINQLEVMLDTRLLVRTTRHVRLTAAGAELMERAKRLVVETQRLVRDFQSRSANFTGQVSVSVAPTVASSVIPFVLLTLEGDYPGIRVALREDLGADMLEAVRNGSVDFAIGPYSDVPDTLSFEPIFEQKFFLILRCEHALAIRGSAQLADLDELELLCASAGSTARDVLETAARGAGVTIRPKYETMHYPTLFAMASAGLGATVMPTVNPDILVAIGLKAVPILGAQLLRPVGTIRPRGEPLSPPGEAFLQVLRFTAAEMQERLGLIARPLVPIDQLS